MTKKKFAIGCLATIGGVVVILGAIGIVTSITSTPDTEESPDTTQTPVETERAESPVQTSPITTGGEEPEEGEVSLTPVEVELIKAQGEGDIEIAAFGAGSVVSIKLLIISQSDEFLNVAILPGTIFESQAASVQSMVVTTKRMLLVEPHESVGPISIDATSINIELDVANESDSLVLSMNRASGDIMKLLNLADFQGESSRVQQFAVWTITDNRGRNEYAGIGTLGFGSGPSDEEIERIRFLFDKAGISAKDYRVLQKPIYVELIDAKSRGLIEVNVSGEDSIDRIQMSLSSKSDDTLEIAILPGTIFVPRVASIQSMVVIVEKVLLLYPYETVGPINIGAACASMQLDVPSESDSLSLSMTPAPEDLMKLLELSDFHEETFRVRQFAIWTITDNPGRNEYVGIGYFGMGTGPNNEEIGRIRSLFDKAGIRIDKYKAL